MTAAATTKTKLDFTAPVDSLLEATAKLLSVVPSKSPKPVLSNIHFGVRDGVLELSGTDFVAGIHYSIPAATVTSEGSGLLNGIKFSDLLKEFRGVDARLVFNPRGGCQFKARGGSFKVVGDDVRDYPKTRRFEGKPGVKLTGAELVEMIKKTEFAKAPEESRLTIHGVLFEYKEGNLRLVATDNKRMAVNERPFESKGQDFSVSVPPEFLKAVLKVTTKDISGKEAVLGVTGTKIFYLLPGATVYSTVLQGTYPPYGEVYGIKLKHHFDCSVSELLSTLRRTMLVNGDLAAFLFENDAFHLKGASSDVGAGTATMAVDLQLPDDMERVRVGFNPSYFRDALEAMTSKKCRFYFEGPRKAGILKEILTVKEGEGEEVVEKEVLSERFLYAVMPALLPGAS